MRGREGGRESGREGGRGKEGGRVIVYRGSNEGK